MKKTLLTLLLPTILFSCKQQNESQNVQNDQLVAISDTLTKNLQSAFEMDAIVGFSVAVVNDKGLIYENGFGFADIEQTKKYSANTSQNIASISKSLIGIALLKAQELEKLSLEDPINTYLPIKIVNPNHPEVPILIKHLAYHTSSIMDLDEIYSKSYVLEKSEHDDNEGVYDWFSMPNERITLLEFIEKSLLEKGEWYQKGMFSETAPGTAREYSNIGAALCALIIENATAQSYQSFTRKYILEPLQMSSSGWSSADINVTDRSRLFATHELMIAEYSLITFADGGLISSSKDLGLFLTELMKGYKGSGTLLTKSSYEQLYKKHTFPNTDEGEAFGIFIEYANNFIRVKEDVIGHDGSDPGVMTGMYFNPKTETGKILFVNTDSDFDDNYWPEVQRIWKSLIQFESQLASSAAD